MKLKKLKGLRSLKSPYRVPKLKVPKIYRKNVNKILK
jgi:hypothetical protein